MSVSGSSPTPSKIATRGALIGALGVLLSACATQPAAPLPDMTAWETRQAVLAGLESWGFNGRIAVRTADDGFNGKLRYQQDSGDFRAVMSGPLGIGTVQLERADDALYYTDKDGIQTRFTDPEVELRYRFGWDVPLESLRYWALGIPDPGRPAETSLNEAGQLATLTQGGWSVDVGKYRDAGGQAMPQRMTVTNGVTRVTLVIDSWRLGPSR